MNERELRARIEAAQTRLVALDAELPALKAAELAAREQVTAARAAIEEAKKNFTKVQGVAWRAQAAKEANRSQRAELLMAIDKDTATLEHWAAVDRAPIVHSLWQAAPPVREGAL